MSEHRAGYRGYIGSRAYGEGRVPQHVQNLVIREYCRQRGLDYLLSVSEYAMPGCFMMLEQTLAELSAIRGIVLYSLFMLPEEREQRLSVFERVLAAGAELHAAVESCAVREPADIAPIEDIWRVRQWLPYCPTVV